MEIQKYQSESPASLVFAFSDAKCGSGSVAQESRRSEEREQSAYEHTDARPAAKEPEEKEPEAREKKESGSRDKKKKLGRDRDQRELAKQVANQVRLLLLVI